MGGGMVIGGGLIIKFGPCIGTFREKLHLGGLSERGLYSLSKPGAVM